MARNWSCVITALMAAAMLLSFATSPAAADTGDQIQEKLQAFYEYSGTRLAFTRAELPRGQYHDIMIPLSEAGRLKALDICLREVKKYPPGYLGQMKLGAIGVFAGCASRSGDGYRAYNKELGGYRYYGIWNGNNGIAAAYYSDSQLPLTFHHEIFHHVDGTHNGVTDSSRYFSSDDRRFKLAISGQQRYRALAIDEADLKALSRQREGYTLKNAVSDYASKTNGEDQAETARHFMTTLSDSLIQATRQPELPGSQRILHCLNQYEQAVPDGPGVDWFVNVALNRPQPSEYAVRPASATAPLFSEALKTPDDVIKGLRDYAYTGRSGWDGVDGKEKQARAALIAASKLDKKDLSDNQAESIVTLSARVTHQLLRYRIRAKDESVVRYAIWGGENDEGVNWTLRNDVSTFGTDALRLKTIGELSPKQSNLLTRMQIQNLRLMAKYFDFINSNWEVTGGTLTVFHQSRDQFAQALPAAQKSLATSIIASDLGDLARRLPADGEPKLLDAVARLNRLSPLPPRRTNPFMKNIDRKISDETVRAAIKMSQPACVRFPNASGTCISPDGKILTCAHVAHALGKKMTCTFPDGTTHVGICTAYSEYFDLALVEIRGAKDLPYAPLAAAAPEIGTRIVAIGQPGSRTPDGSATGYQPFAVSTGRVRGFKKDRLGYQMLGALKHDAWTYWGHSGCSLFNEQGEIIGIHNSWDADTAMRHGVTHEAIVHFLKKADPEFAKAN